MPVSTMALPAGACLMPTMTRLSSGAGTAVYTRWEERSLILAQVSLSFTASKATPSTNASLNAISRLPSGMAGRVPENLITSTRLVMLATILWVAGAESRKCRLSCSPSLRNCTPRMFTMPPSAGGGEAGGSAGCLAGGEAPWASTARGASNAAPSSTRQISMAARGQGRKAGAGARVRMAAVRGGRRSGGNAARGRGAGATGVVTGSVTGAEPAVPPMGCCGSARPAVLQVWLARLSSMCPCGRTPRPPPETGAPVESGRHGRVLPS